jgi:hypothetical protein
MKPNAVGNLTVEIKDLNLNLNTSKVKVKWALIVKPIQLELYGISTWVSEQESDPDQGNGIVYKTLCESARRHFLSPPKPEILTKVNIFIYQITPK